MLLLTSILELFGRNPSWIDRLSESNFLSTLIGAVVGAVLGAATGGVISYKLQKIDFVRRQEEDLSKLQSSNRVVFLSILTHVHNIHDVYVEYVDRLKRTRERLNIPKESNIPPREFPTHIDLPERINISSQELAVFLDQHGVDIYGRLFNVLRHYNSLVSALEFYKVESVSFHSAMIEESHNVTGPIHTNRVNLAVQEKRIELHLRNIEKNTKSEISMSRDVLSDILIIAESVYGQADIMKNPAFNGLLKEDSDRK